MKRLDVMMAAILGMLATATGHAPRPSASGQGRKSTPKMLEDKAVAREARGVSAIPKAIAKRERKAALRLERAQ